MKKIITLATVALAATLGLSANENPVITLNLSESATPLEFNQENGAWTETYSEEAPSIDSQCFSFVHNVMAEWQTWWGFTASNSTDNKRQDDTLKYQFSNMAKGGIALNEDGSIKLDDFGAPVTTGEMPYLVAYYSPYMGARPLSLGFNDGKLYETVGVYVNLNSYPYYCIEYGDNFARAFNNGDNFTLTIHGVAPDESVKEVTVSLASYANGNLTINRGWSYVDLSSLGAVNEIYFTMKSTDTGAYGDNTPAYFCMDKLMVKEASADALNQIAYEQAKISYDRAAKVVSIEGAEFAQIYDAAGHMLKSTDNGSISVSDLAPGVYVVKAGNSTLKIVK